MVQTVVGLNSQTVVFTLLKFLFGRINPRLGVTVERAHKKTSVPMTTARPGLQLEDTFNLGRDE